MAAPYTSQTISGYNDNPPADDGSQTEANRVKWATIKEKLPDPIKALAEAINTQNVAAFAKVVGGAGITSTAISYQVVNGDHGKLVRVTGASVTITTPDATIVTSPFVFAVLNNSVGDITLDGSGSQTIDGDASITLVSGEGILLWTDGSNWYSVGRVLKTQVVPQGYLTLTSATPIITGDVAAATAVYYTPFVGNLIPIPDGTKFTVREFTELTLTLNSNHVANAIYDVFGFNDGGTIRIGTGPAWNTATAGSGARGTGAGTTELERLKGLWTNKVAATLRNGSTTYNISAKCGIYLGSIAMDGTNGQVTCHRTYGQSRKFGVWNAFNQKPIILQMGDATGSWNYSTNTIRQSNNAAANTAAVFMGLAEEFAKIAFRQRLTMSNEQTNVDAAATIGIGVNSTTAFSGQVGTELVAISTASHSASFQCLATATHIIAPSLGLNNINALERGDNAGTSSTPTFNGGNDDMLMTVEYLG